MSERFASSKFSDFTIEEELYRSQAGAVYRAVFKYNQKEYVLKERTLPKSKSSKEIMNEVKLLLQLDHHNVTKCEGWFRDDARQSIFLVLEFCGGGDLSSMISKQRSNHQRFSEKQVWDIFCQLCHGLRHLHEHGIIHRDLKPLNIMVSTSGKHFKLGDLGVSRQLSEDTVLVRSFYGTPLYLSPELVESKPYNEKTDIWSLGVILYELCCLCPPFQGNTLLDVAKMVSTGKYPPLPGHYSSQLHRCVGWMLQLDYTKRPNVVQLINFAEERLSKLQGAAPSGTATVGKVSDGRVDLARPTPRADSADTESDDQHSEADADSLDPPEAMPSRQTARRRGSAGTAAGAPASALQAPRSRHAGTEVGSDDDTASEEEGAAPARSAKPSSKQQPGSDPLSRRSVAGFVDPSHSDEAARQQQHYRQAGRTGRHSLQELSAEKHRQKSSQQQHSADHRGGRGGSGEEAVQVDVQRLLVLMRREAGSLRKLLQLRDFVATNPEALEQSTQEGLSLKARMEAVQHRMLTLEAAVRSGGQMLKRDAERFSLSGPNHPPQPAAVTQQQGNSAGAEAGSGSTSTGAPVTRLPHRPGEPDVLGLDINADRKGHGRHLVDPAYFSGRQPQRPATTGGGVTHKPSSDSSAPLAVHVSEPVGVAEDDVGRRRRKPGSGGDAEVKLRKSPERKQVPQQSHHLAYEAPTATGKAASDGAALFDNAAFSAPGRPPMQQGLVDAAVKVIGDSAAARREQYRPVFAAKPGLFQPHGGPTKPCRGSQQINGFESPRMGEIAAGDSSRAPGVSLRKQHIQFLAEEELPCRPFEQRGDRRRPATAGAARSAAATRRGPVKDVNEARKEELWAKWEKGDLLGGVFGAAGAGGVLPLPSLVNVRRRPQTAAVQERGSAAAVDVAAAAMLPENGRSPLRRREPREPEQYVDIMDAACRDIADKYRRPAHRRLKSDVTHPGYVLPPPAVPPATDERVVVPAPAVPPAACRAETDRAAHGLQGRRDRVPPRYDGDSLDGGAADDPTSPVKYPRGAASREQYERERSAQSRRGEIKLRGAGHHAHGELLPEELRHHKDSAFNLLVGR